LPRRPRSDSIVGVARIVLVHGAFNELWGPHELRARWVPALRDGLWHHGVVVDDPDVDICFYGDLFRRDPDAPDADAFVQSRAGVADLLANLGADAGLEALGQAASEATFDRTVDMITTMTTEPHLREQVQARIDAVVTPETRVVVGHSLGSVIAYGALRRNPEWSVHTLVTLGSPLGQPMVLSQLDPPVAPGSTAPWPGSVQRWVNVAAVGDHAAAVARLADVYGEGVTDVRVDNGHRAHDPEPYLNAAATGAAVAAALAS
jgi:pimeloyl-ACP methyl ester carboxylesterase